MKSRIVSLTPAQWRMMQRLAVGVSMPTSRYNELSSRQIQALWRKDCIAVVVGNPSVWAITRFGMEVLNKGGRALWTEGAEQIL